MLTPDMRILVVEDDNKIASFIAKGLKQAGYAVDRCADGEEALVLAETTAYDAAVANLASGEANYKRLQQLQSFERVTAPFDGVVTSRSVDVGNLVSAGATLGGSSTSARPLFTVAGTDTVRVYVNVPQSAMSLVQRKASADILVRELPGSAFRGVVAAMARLRPGDDPHPGNNPIKRIRARPRASSAKSTGRLEARGLDTKCLAKCAALQGGLHPGSRIALMAVVGIVDVAFPQYLRGHLGHLAGVTDVSEDRFG